MSNSSKEDLEKEKLREEIRALRRWEISKPSFLIGAATALVTVYLGYRSNLFSALRAEVEAKRALLEMQKIELQHQTDSLQALVLSVQRVGNAAADSTLAALQRKTQLLATMSRQVDSLKRNCDPQIIQRLERAVAKAPQVDRRPFVLFESGQTIAIVASLYGLTPEELLRLNPQLEMGANNVGKKVYLPSLKTD